MNGYWIWEVVHIIHRFSQSVAGADVQTQQLDTPVAAAPRVLLTQRHSSISHRVQEAPLNFNIMRFKGDLVPTEQNYWSCEDAVRPLFALFLYNDYISNVEGY